MTSFTFTKHVGGLWASIFIQIINGIFLLVKAGFMLLCKVAESVEGLMEARRNANKTQQRRDYVPQAKESRGRAGHTRSKIRNGYVAPAQQTRYPVACASPGGVAWQSRGNRGYVSVTYFRPLTDQDIRNQTRGIIVP